MSLARTIRKGVAVADKVTETLQVYVDHFAWIGTGTTYSEPLFDDAVSRLALVEEQEKLISLSATQSILQKAKVTFLRPIEANGAAERREPIDSRDKIVLPDGYTGPILKVEGFTNPETNESYYTVVTLG